MIKKVDFSLGEQHPLDRGLKICELYANFLLGLRDNSILIVLFPRMFLFQNHLKYFVTCYLSLPVWPLLKVLILAQEEVANFHDKCLLDGNIHHLHWVLEAVKSLIALLYHLKQAIKFKKYILLEECPFDQVPLSCNFQFHLLFRDSVYAFSAFEPMQ